MLHPLPLSPSPVFPFPLSSPILEAVVKPGLRPVPKFPMVLELEKDQDIVLKSGMRHTTPCSKKAVRTDSPPEGSCCGPYLISWPLLPDKCLSSRRINVSVQICCEVSRNMSSRSTPEEFFVGCFFTSWWNQVNSWAPALDPYHLCSSPLYVLVSSLFWLMSSSVIPDNAWAWCGGRSMPEAAPQRQFGYNHSLRESSICLNCTHR